MKADQAYFEEFKTACIAYQEVLRLDQWDLQVEHADIENQADALCFWDDGMVARIRLTNREDVDVLYSPQRLAFHECMEVFLWPLRELLEKIIKPKRTDRAIHSIINTAENKLFK